MAGPGASGVSKQLARLDALPLQPPVTPDSVVESNGMLTVTQTVCYTNTPYAGMDWQDSSDLSQPWHKSPIAFFWNTAVYPCRTFQTTFAIGSSSNQFHRVEIVP
jgi:hypothetical protein